MDKPNIGYNPDKKEDLVVFEDEKGIIRQVSKDSRIYKKWLKRMEKKSC